MTWGEGLESSTLANLKAYLLTRENQVQRSESRFRLTLNGQENTHELHTSISFLPSSLPFLSFPYSSTQLQFQSLQNKYLLNRFSSSIDSECKKTGGKSNGLYCCVQTFIRAVQCMTSTALYCLLSQYRPNSILAFSYPFLCFLRQIQQENTDQRRTRELQTSQQLGRNSIFRLKLSQFEKKGYVSKATEKESQPHRYPVSSSLHFSPKEHQKEEEGQGKVKRPNKLSIQPWFPPVLSRPTTLSHLLYTKREQGE